MRNLEDQLIASPGPTSSLAARLWSKASYATMKESNISAGIRMAAFAFSQSKRLGCRGLQRLPHGSRRTPANPFSTTCARCSIAAPELDLVAFEPSDEAGSLRRLRIVPASPSYFTGRPNSTDDFLRVEALYRKYQMLPRLAAEDSPRIAWNSHDHYKARSGEPVKLSRYKSMIEALQQLSQIPAEIRPVEIDEVMERFRKAINPFDNVPAAGIVDEYGRAKGVGGRKTSSAVAWVVEGEGEVLVNGKSLTQMFGRVHDRESVIWALKATGRIDKYNVWALVKGGGVTGQAEALTLAVARALLLHEPLLEPALREGQFECSRRTAEYGHHNNGGLLTFLSCSRLRGARSSRRGEEEGWKTQGTQGAAVGQAVTIQLDLDGIRLLGGGTTLLHVAHLSLRPIPPRWSGLAPLQHGVGVEPRS